MPGFLAPNSAQHAGSSVPSAQVETKRRHRWIFSVFWNDSDMQRTSVYLQSAQRPHAVIDEATMHHDEEQAYFAGKYYWEPIELVFYDVQSPIDSSQRIYDWFKEVINVPDATVSLPSEHKKNCALNMTDGQGTSIEEWVLYNCWPKDVNWNELDYTSTEIQTINVSLRFDRAQKDEE